MNKHVPKSYFAPAGRVSEQVLLHEKSIVSDSELIKTLLNAMPDLLLVLNSKRQIVAVNQKLLNTFGVENPEEMLGLRPGEAVGCIHSKGAPDGCGTSRNCAVCGAVIAILASQSTGLPQKRECQLMMHSQILFFRFLCLCNINMLQDQKPPIFDFLRGHQLMTGNDCHALDLDVMATPVEIEGEIFTVLALRDISSEKRRYVMERVFFHDILNNVGGIRGLASLLQEETSAEAAEEYKGWMVDLADNLIEEINHQKRLLDAERGAYQSKFEQVNLSELLWGIKKLYENHKVVQGRTIVIEDVPDCKLVTDKPLLRRIIGNMVLNALEASKSGDIVSIWVHCQAERVRISVTNQGEMSVEVQLHLFKRSFSTKEKEGRGLGTYSMKLFGERYLGGVVGFYSNNGITTFFIELPFE